MKAPLHVSNSVRKLNPGLYPPLGTGASPKLEPGARHEAQGTDPVENPDLPRYRVRITSVRQRLCDADNLAVKWHVDAIRKLGLIPDDAPTVIDLEVSQRKPALGEAEGTLITVETKEQPCHEKTNT